VGNTFNRSHGTATAENEKFGSRSNPLKVLGSLTITSFIAGLALVSLLQAQEKKIKRDELPAAVEKTVAEQSHAATIKGFSTEIENNKAIYEVELTVNGHQKDISMDEQGNIVEVEEEVTLDSLPAAVKKGLIKTAGTGLIDKVESLTKNGKLVAYEAVVNDGAKHHEIQVGPTGKQLAHPE
jgi:hypothetical protein